LTGRLDRPQRAAAAPGEAFPALLAAAAVALFGCAPGGGDAEVETDVGACAAYAQSDPSSAPTAARAAISAGEAVFIGLKRDGRVLTPGVPALLARGRLKVLDLSDMLCVPPRARLKAYVRTYNQTLRVDPRF
jgi:hypothetical protein